MNDNMLNGYRQMASKIAMDESATEREQEMAQVMIGIIEAVKQLRRDMESATDPRLYSLGGR